MQPAEQAVPREKRELHPSTLSSTAGRLYASPHWLRSLRHHACHPASDKRARPCQLSSGKQGKACQSNHPSSVNFSLGIFLLDMAQRRHAPDDATLTKMQARRRGLVRLVPFLVPLASSISSTHEYRLSLVLGVAVNGMQSCAALERKLGKDECGTVCYFSSGQCSCTDTIGT